MLRQCLKLVHRVRVFYVLAALLGVYVLVYMLRVSNIRDEVRGVFIQHIFRKAWWTCPNAEASALFQPQVVDARHPFVPCPEGEVQFPPMPRRIHQVYTTRWIPKSVSKYVETWLDNHPDYEYWFWTDEDAELFMREVYPGYLELYQSYRLPLHRADVIRYFILHHYGGVYADLDVEAIRPIDPLMKGMSILLTTEPWEQSTLLYMQPQLISNALLVSSPGHMFLQQIIDNLKYYKSRLERREDDPTFAIYGTGPNMVQAAWRTYSRYYKCCRIFPEYAVEIIPSEFMMPSTDVKQADNFKRICQHTEQKTRVGGIQAMDLERACLNLSRGNWKIGTTDRSITNHHWVHIGSMNDTAKLYDLMTMAFKYQVSLALQPRDILLITLNHLDAIRTYVKDSTTAASAVEDVYAQVLKEYGSMTNGEFMLVRQTLMIFFQDLHIRVSIFLKDKLQGSNGRFILHPGGQLPWGTEQPGKITLFTTSGAVSKTLEFNAKGSYQKLAKQGSADLRGDRVTKLGTNMYNLVRPVETTVVPAPSSGRLPTTSDLDARTCHPNSKAQLDLLARLITPQTKKTATEFRLNLFTTDEEESIAEKDRPAPVIDSGHMIRIDARQAKPSAELNRIMGELSVDGGQSSYQDEDDLLALMDQA